MMIDASWVTMRHRMWMWADGGVPTEGEDVGAAEVEALGCEEAAMVLLASVLPFAASAVAEIAESVAVVGG
jgi:hypothetical protein